MDRRNFLKTIGAVSAGLVFSPAIADTAKNEKPNIILMMADDFGYECLSVNGGEPYKTPVLDQLAAKGLQFTNCCAQPLCTPSRAKIMTGRHNFRNYIRFGVLKKDEKTFGHVLKAADYKTCIVGKWQLGRDRKLIGHFGFDEYCLWWLEDKSDRYRNPKLIENAAGELAMITGQKPVVRKARKSVANFKLREGQAIGCSVTLRGTRMWEFFDRLMNVSLPRVRDFKGLSPKAFDGRGNYSLGVREQIIFPEVDYDKIEHVTGLNVTICTTARNDAEGKSLLTHLGVPFRQ